MPVVEIATDAQYRRDHDGGYVETCIGCGATRDGDAAACRCGRGFERLRRGFLVTQWTPASIPVALPARCPHCLGTPSRTIAIWDQRFTAATAGGARESHLRIEVPVCARVYQPIWLYLAQVALITLTVMFGLLGAMAGVWPALVIAAACLYGAIRAHRARGWIRFVRFDHRAYRIAARRPEYAHDLAARNRGRVLGRR